ncbi:ABC transporter, ATP-binding protein [delta proteobacterium NaphS2]|nr:ABC transporter, ATP-binding protein [delta proteobacterium NaphS2]
MQAIRTKDVFKTYRLYKKPVDRLKEALTRRSRHQFFEALKDITFDVASGESIGIIGENGAGKSTLLKILAGTVTPSQGEVTISGRVAALLELGTGFHSEFTGRQNIYLNAALLGLEQSEISTKESTIIDFAELGEFIDRPIKTYSSGMIMRLAFSVATSVNPDILIIDEALSVGDHYFQQKCIDRMTQFRTQGKTILFCSHSTYSVNLLCNRAIWLHQGGIRRDGPATEVTADYVNFLRAKEKAVVREHHAPSKDKTHIPVIITAIHLNGQTGPITLQYRESLSILLEFESLVDDAFCIGMGIRRGGEKFWHAVNMTHDGHKPLKGKGRGRVLLKYDSCHCCRASIRWWDLYLMKQAFLLHHKMDSTPFTIVPPPQWRNEMGLLALDHQWEILDSPMKA